MVIIQAKIRTISNKTTEGPKVSSLNRPSVYPSQVCTASKYPCGYLSWQPKSVATESARLYAARRPEESVPADSIPQSSHPFGSQPADPALPRSSPKPSEMP
ncbi:hypothetical protein Tco_0680770 [Tanacetum coccineum]|uniref:Uncharacterized protein n=1 Tax=Tanacetum coccineum TaxID=301880 RepID=A0ABQ4XMB4_9ASTR